MGDHFVGYEMLYHSAAMYQLLNESIGGGVATL
jgi:hypothetical protein